MMHLSDPALRTEFFGDCSNTASFASGPLAEGFSYSSESGVFLTGRASVRRLTSWAR